MAEDFYINLLQDSKAKYFLLCLVSWIKNHQGAFEGAWVSGFTWGHPIYSKWKWRQTLLICFGDKYKLKGKIMLIQPSALKWSINKKCQLLHCSALFWIFNISLFFTLVKMHAHINHKYIKMYFLYICVHICVKIGSCKLHWPLFTCLFINNPDWVYQDST